MAVFLAILTILRCKEGLSAKICKIILFNRRLWCLYALGLVLWQKELSPADRAKI